MAEQQMTGEQTNFYLKACSDEIRDLKRYQWDAARLCVLIQAGLLALSRFPHSVIPIDYRAALTIVCLATIPAWIFLNRALQDALRRHRNLAQSIEKSTESPPIFEAPDRKSVPRVLTGIVTISAVLISVAIWTG